MPPLLSGPCAFRKDPRLMEQGLALFQELGERWWEAVVLDGLGIVSLIRNDWDAAKRQLASALMGLGEYDLAWEQAQKAYRICVRIDDLALTPPACMISGRLAWVKGDEQEAERWFQESVAQYERANKETKIAWAWTSMGLLLWQRGRRSDAVEWIARALRIEISRRVFDASLDTIALSALGWLWAGQVERAVELCPGCEVCYGGPFALV